MDDTTTTTTTNGTRDKKLQDELMESAHRIWLAGLGALATAEAEGTKMFSRLVERGKDVEARGKDAAADLKEQAKSKVEDAKTQANEAWSGLSDKVDETLTNALHRMGVPTREEIRSLTEKIEALNAKVEQLKPKTAAATPVVVTPTGEPASDV